MPDCVNWNWQVDEIRGLQPLSRISATVVVADFTGYGTARWNTASGKRPTSDEYHDSSYDITIVRDALIEPDEFMRGDELGIAGAYVRGGELGCDRISYSDMPELDSGSEWVFFINPGEVGDANRAVLPELLRAWPLDSDGLVVTDSGDHISIDQLRDIVTSTPYAPDDPFGTKAGG